MTGEQQAEVGVTPHELPYDFTCKRKLQLSKADARGQRATAY